ncbi:zinc finger protein Dzip1 isoform X1 [Polypterus senegalus]|uniref:zinc finger protein Dzip1 isoform X1 n=1 Tax=Polypterus senegalus TaxID=55291 RepID=UPI0019662A62|nr:zinc finger protein Dzip1 isoform X1 [Polypterus senegalus]XP_039601330.1 zinc finger protein Dzip1 isoform X1 [Polypterus senegalus]XP_039601331.1 zinc finger protein Dzip1 isoform X1 [Polypterus senegalus]XP_039601332.1 zinc finger protein Dzip1 isoform X1 [Polypterus senegalus]
MPEVPTTSMMMGAQLPAFKFRSRREGVDYRRINSIDVDRVASELDLNTLQDNIMCVTFCNMDGEKCAYCHNPVDSVLLKLFRLAQLMLEYLLHSQEYLTCSLQVEEGKVHALTCEKEQMMREMEKQAEEIKSLKEECRKRKKIISTQQTMIQAGVANYHKCQCCEKAFMNYSFLQSHIQRRHPEQYINAVEKQKTGQNNKFQEEINKLKEQLELTKSQLETEQQVYRTRLSQEYEHLKAKENEALDRFEKWKKEEKEKLDEEIKIMRETFTAECKALAIKNATLESQLSEVKKSYVSLKSSSSPVNEDVTKCKSNKEERQWKHKEWQDLKEMLKEQEAKWAVKMEKLYEEHNLEKHKLQNDLKKLWSLVAKDKDVYRTSVEELGEKLQQQNEIIIKQKQQIKQLSCKPPEKEKEVKPLTSAPQVPQVNPTVYTRQAHVVSQHILEPIEELSDEDEDSPNISDKRNSSNKLLIDTLRKNPSLTKEIHSVLEQTLEEKLELLGVKSGSRGISNEQLNKIMSKMKVYRQSKEKQMPSFHSIREHLGNQMNKRAVERNVSLNSFVPSLDSHEPISGRQRAQSLSLNERPQLVKQKVKQQTPQPAPRTTSIKNLRTSTPRTPPFSSEDESDEEYMHKVPIQAEAMHSKVHYPETSKASVNSFESDNDWTDVSEMEEIDPGLLSKNHIQNKGAGEAVSSVTVKELTDTIERQLASRTAVTKPVGGVDVVKVPEKKEAAKELKLSDVDDDDWDISSIEETKPPIPEKSQPVFSARKSTESNSSTSIWGTYTGKGGKEGLQEGDASSTLKSSLVTVTDWSDSSDAD